MSLLLALLVDAHETQLLRESRERHLRNLVAACQRRLFGVVPIGPKRQPC